LDSIGTAANGSSAASQASSSGGSTTTHAHNNNNNNNNNGGSGKMDGSPHHRPGSRNGRDNWSKMPEPLNGAPKGEKSEKSSPSRRSLGGGGGGSGSSSKQGSPSSSSRTKGVPPSFGYVKRANGSITSTAEQQNIAMMMAAGGVAANGMPCGRTAHVSAVPRTASGRKVAGGTQTLPNDMNSEYKIFIHF